MTKNIKTIFKLADQLDGGLLQQVTIPKIIAQMLYREGVTIDIYRNSFRKSLFYMSDPFTTGIENELNNLEKGISAPNLPEFKI